MRSPSSRILTDSVAVYSGTGKQDAVGGYYPAYTLVSSRVACSAQPHDYVAVEDQGVLQQWRRWRLTFASATAPSVKVRDKMLLTQSTGATHTLYVEAARDEAGRGMAATIWASERL